MRITSNMMFNTLLGDVQKNMENYQKINEQIASEKKLNKPSDDPAGIARSSQLRSNQSAYKQYLQNVDEGRELLKGTDNALNQLQELLVKVREFAQTNATETATDEEMDIAAQQIDQYIEEAINIANTKVNDRYIFSGHQISSPAYDDSLRVLDPYASTKNSYGGKVTSSGEYTGTSLKTYLVRFTKSGNAGDPSDAGTAKYQISEDNGETWSDESDFTSLQLDLKNADGTDSGVSLNFAAGEISEGDEFRLQIGMGKYMGDDGHIRINTNFNSRIENNINGKELFEDNGFFDTLYKLKNALEARNKNEISATAEELDTLHENIQSNVVKTGVNLNRLEVAENNLTSLAENVLSSIETVEKVDLVDILSRFSQAENALNASITSLSKVFPQSLINMI